MPATVLGLTRASALRVSLAYGGASIDEPIEWIHSSDLSDPTPFLSDGQMVLTTGRQFAENATQQEYDDYVERLVARNLVAVGFGTEVIRSGIPPELVAACRRFGLPLVEVPYSTPFIAIIRWAADLLNREARARQDWARDAQRAVSLAALDRGGDLGDVLRELAQQLGAVVVLQGIDGEVQSHFGVGVLSRARREALRAEAVRLMRSGRRSGSSFAFDDDGRATVQTLGPQHDLHGVLAVCGDELDSAAQSVVTTAVALAEVSLEQERASRQEARVLRSQLLQLALAGQLEVVRRTLAAAERDLPLAPVRVFVCSTHEPLEQLDDALELSSEFRGGTVFTALHAERLVAIVSDGDRASLEAALLRRDARSGVSTAVSLDDLQHGIVQATRAHALAKGSATPIVAFDSMEGQGVLGLLARDETAEIATTRLAPLLGSDSGRELLHECTVWLDHNGQWDPAAKQLGIHRHSLRAHVAIVGQALALSLDRFGDRAQLWALLQAVDDDRAG